MNKRILKEIENGYKSEEFDFMLDSDGTYGDKNICYLKFVPKTGIYEGQTHVLNIKFIYNDNQPYSFPRDPPNIIFITPIYHTNIAECGSICLDILKDKWSPMLNIEAVFRSILSLLDDPNTSSPFNGSASRDYTKNKNDLANYKNICMKYYTDKMDSKFYGEIQKIMNATEYNKS